MLNSKFTDPLELEYIDGLRWKITSAFDYVDSRYGRTISVPAGFVTDFASIPRVLWSVLPPTGPLYGKAAVIHDFLYAKKGVLVCGTYRRADADLVFRDAMQMLGVNPAKRQTMYLTVRAFGPRW